MFPPPEVSPILERIAELLTSTNSTLAVSESACGGLISAYLVSVPGASKYFVGSTTTYALRSRLRLSGWSQEDIQSYTGPSEVVASRLSRNIRMELGATWTLAETGWAGPSAEPGTLGTVFVAISGPKGHFSLTHATDSAERRKNMALFAKRALEFLVETLEQEKSLA